MVEDDNEPPSTYHRRMGQSKSVVDILKTSMDVRPKDYLKEEIQNIQSVKIKLNAEQDGINTTKLNNKSALPPLVPKAQAVGKKAKPAQYRVFDDNVILLNPRIDCSDKEMHQRNGFKSTGQNLYAFFKNENAGFIDNVYKPKQLGLLTKDNTGSIKNVVHVATRPVFEGKKSKYMNESIAPVDNLGLTAI